VLGTNQITMSDSATPQHNPERNGAPDDPSAAEPVHGSPEQPAQSQTPSAVQAQSTHGGTQATLPPVPSTDMTGRIKRMARGRRVVWAAMVVLCVAAGTVGSVLAAHAVARNDAATARQAFHQGSTAIASTLSLAIRHEEQFVVSASTFFADHPKASHAEFAAWVKWARTLRRYPELDALGLLKLPGASPALLLARDTALSIYTPISARGGRALAVETPVYRGNLTPRSVFGRRAASVGWLREVLLPGVVLGEALRGHPGYALRVRYQAGTANVMFADGTPRPDAQNTTIDLHDGWSLRSFGAPAGSGVLADGSALVVLTGGILLSALLGLLVFLVGTRRRQEPVPADAPEVRKLPEENLYEALTGLPNRALTLDRAGRMVARAGRDSGMLAGALFVDIDQLGEVSEKLGQAAGDQLLRIVGERLKDVVRTGDTVGRIGGDEFLVLVESVARGVRLDSLAQRMIEALHKPVELDGFGPSFVLTASIGVAFGRYATPDDLLRDAHLALASAKAAGKDRYTLFNANMRTVIEGRAVLEAELNAALAERQFFLLYQPIYDLSTCRVAGLQALIRWQHPTQGVLVPADFIPLAEETGLIVPIGRFALEEACGRAAAWDVAGGPAVDPAVPAVPSGARIGVSVKISAHQLNRDGFVTDVRRALQQSGIEPSLLTLEIAETTVMRDLAATAERLGEIKPLGVRIAIDDFGGSGYARHSDLQRLPLDFLRVDRSSIAASEDEHYRSWLLEAILIVGRGLSLPVIATGIETYEQLSTLQAMGCTMAQGFFMGKPVPADAVASLFDAPFPAMPPTSTSPVQRTASTPGPESALSGALERLDAQPGG
jgi:diguanylate cyclase (GGDEF)-like protein